MAKKLFELNPHLDRAALAKRFAADRRVQIRDVLTAETAREIRDILAKGTPWGVAVQGGTVPNGGPSISFAELAQPEGKRKAAERSQTSHEAAARGDYAFRYGHYSLVDAYLKKQNEGGPHDLLLEHLNAPDFMQLARDVTGIAELVKADAQATLYAPNHFLGHHSDSHVAEGWRVAYVMNFTVDDWRPDWGGYLQFFDDDGDIVAGYKPRFNALNLLLVPQAHSVSYVPPFAPLGRFAVTGWFRDR